MAYESAKPSASKPSASGSKSSNKLAAAAAQEKKSGQPTSSSEVALQECDAIEEAIAALKVRYEHYFLGNDRLPPAREHEDLKKRLMKLKGSFVRNTAAKFRVQSLATKFGTYERLWSRTLQEIENGTYKRDLNKAKRRAQKADKPKSAKGPVDLTQEVPDDFDVEEIEELHEEVPPPPVARPVPAVAPVSPPRGMPSIAPVVPPVAPAMPSVAPMIPSIAPVVPAIKPVAPAIAPLVPAVAPMVPPVAPRIAPVAGTPAAAPKAPGLARTGTPVAGTPVVGTPAAGTPAAGMPPRTVSRPNVPIAAKPAGTAPPRPAAASGSGELSEDKLKAVYDAYVSAKRRNKEDTSKMSYDSVAASLRKQVPELIKQHNAKSVEFKVVIKDGKAVLKAVPK
jgi:hypothetical protein